MSYEKAKLNGKILLLAACGGLAVAAAKTDKVLSEKTPVFKYDTEVSKTEASGMDSDAATATVSFMAAAAALYGLGRKENENDTRPILRRMMDRSRG